MVYYNCFGLVLGGFWVGFCCLGMSGCWWWVLYAGEASRFGLLVGFAGLDWFWVLIWVGFGVGGCLGWVLGWVGLWWDC